MLVGINFAQRFMKNFLGLFSELLHFHVRFGFRVFVRDFAAFFT